MGGRGEAYENLLQLAKETEDLAAQERELFSPILKKWHTTAGSIAAVTLHQCYGEVLKQHLAGTKMLNSEIVGVLQRAAKLEKVLVQMVVEDFDECGNGGKVIVREMMPYEVDTVTIRLLGQWIDERLKKGKKLLLSAKKTEVNQFTFWILNLWLKSILIGCNLCCRHGTRSRKPSCTRIRRSS